MKLIHEDKGINYQVVDISQLEDIPLIIAESFSSSEVMAVTQNISPSEMTQLVKQFGCKADQESLTIVAQSHDTEEILGVLLANDWGKMSSEKIIFPSDKFNPILAILEELNTEYKQGKVIGENRYLHHEFLAVKKQYRGKNIAHNLIAACLENAVSKGYRKAVATATGTASQHIHRKLGFHDCIKIPYKTFTYQNEKVFASIEGDCILMDKSLI